MRDLKIKPGMDTPKAKLKNPTPKDAESILKKHMDKRQKEKEPESRDPVRYATDLSLIHIYQCPERQHGKYHHPCHLREESAGLPLVCAGTRKMMRYYDGH